MTVPDENENENEIARMRDRRHGTDSAPQGRRGWILFARLVAALIGASHAIAGAVALFRSDFYLATPDGLVVTAGYAAWGWTHLALGAALIGVAALTNRYWAPSTLVVLTMISVLANLLFLAAHPMWSILMIALDVVVIYALVVRGRELGSR